ncbi:MAG: hypothetical protein LQ337_008573 [Flavoplaca oasis]|nr:MAG: hypothetical protein LQ337_008573 [Flavoplaca oasis]
MACSLIPSEIRLRIFEFCPDVPTAASLAQTSKPFNDTWMSYKKPVCLGILERSVECYEDARNLVTQDMFESRVTTEVLGQSFENFTTCILANLKTAERAYNVIINEPMCFGLTNDGEHRETGPVRVINGVVILNSVERRRFISAWYRIETIQAMLLRLPDRDVHACLPEAISDHDVFLMTEVTRTLCSAHDISDSGNRTMLDLEVLHILPGSSKIITYGGSSSQLCACRWHDTLRHVGSVAASRINQSRSWQYLGLRVLLDNYQYAFEK